MSPEWWAHTTLKVLLASAAVGTALSLRGFRRATPGSGWRVLSAGVAAVFGLLFVWIYLSIVLGD